MRELTQDEERLVWRAAKFSLSRYMLKLPDAHRKTLDQDALLMAGFEGAIRAVRCYKPGRGSSLYTWVIYYAKGYMQHEGRSQFRGKHTDYEGRTRPIVWISTDFQTDEGDLLDTVGLSVDGPEQAYNSPVAEELGKLGQWLECLADRERHVIRRRFVDQWSQARVGKELGVCQMQAFRIERKALAKLRKAAGIC